MGSDNRNSEDEGLGGLPEIMLDSQSGQVACANLSFGVFTEMGEKRFAVPWSLLGLDTANKRFVLDVGQDRLSSTPWFVWPCPTFLLD
ncbi:PRC-barrel domain-containing protein [Pseudomonas nitroreducens]|uniref:PRC-barrel domain-containing protein n=1 Tax=Pseudomonas nitroreducens TaxID=46680 RepID=UPI00382BD6FF